MRATADRLRRVTSTIVKAGGSATEEADLVARHLVDANLAGHDSHGVGMIPTYVRHMHAGLVVPNTRAKLVKDDGPTLMFDGLRGYGRSVAEQGSRRARVRSRSGIALSASIWRSALSAATRSSFSSDGQLCAWAGRSRAKPEARVATSLAHFSSPSLASSPQTRMRRSRASPRTDACG